MQQRNEIDDNNVFKNNDITTKNNENKILNVNYIDNSQDDAISNVQDNT